MRHLPLRVTNPDSEWVYQKNHNGQYVHSTGGLDDLLQALQLGLQIKILDQPVQVLGMDS
jgi:hypothetical protein